MSKAKFFTAWPRWYIVAVIVLGVPHESTGQTSASASEPASLPAVIYGTCAADDIERLIDAAILHEAQAKVCRDAFAVYLMALDELRQVGGAELVDAGFLQQRALRSVLVPEDRGAILFPGLEMDGPVRAPPDDPRWVTLREISAAVHNTRRDIRRRHHDLLITLFASLQIVLDEAGNSFFTARQFILLELADAGADVALRNQKFMHVDVASLARESMIDGVLADVCARFAARQEGRLDEAAFRVQIDEILREYYIRLEPLLTKQQFELGEIMKPSAVVFSHTPTEAEMDDTLKRSGRLWAGRHDIDAMAAEQIECAIAESVGNDLAKHWRRVFQESVAPHLFKRWPSLSIADWFEAQSDVTDEQRIESRALQDEHDWQYQNAVQNAYRMGLTVMREKGTFLMAGTDVRGHERYWLAVLGVNEIGMRAIDRARALVTESQLLRFRRWLPRHVSQFGPSVIRNFLADDDVERLLRLQNSLKP